MDLTENQRALIASIIRDYLEFSKDPKSFIEEIGELQTALNPKSEYSGKFKIIRSVLKNPEAYLLRLEEIGPKIFLCDVVWEILNEIEKFLLEQATSVKIDLKQTVWSKEEIYKLSQQANEDFKKEFESNPYLVNEENPLSALPILNDKTYTRILLFQERKLEVPNYYSITLVRPIVVLNTFCAGEVKSENIFFREFQNIFSSDAQQNAYYRQLKAKVDEEAEKDAIRIIKEVWKRKFSVDIPDSVPESILTNATYLKLLETKKINFKDLSFPSDTPLARVLRETKITNLLASGVSDLVKYGVLTISQASDLQPGALLLIGNPIYHQLLKDKTIRFARIVNVEKNRAAFLVYPPIANLVKQGKLPFYTACRLPFKIRPIFGMPTYTNYFSKHPDFNWNVLRFYKEEACQYLQNKRIADLIVNDIIDFNDVKYMSKETFDNFTSDSIYDLLKAGAIDKEKARYLQATTPDYLKSFPMLASWIRAGITTFPEVELYSFGVLIPDVFSKRLLNIIFNNPFKINNEIDNLNCLLSESETWMQECKTTQKEFWHDVIMQILPTIHNYVKQQNTYDGNINQHYFKVLKILEIANPLTAFENMLNWADNTLQERSRQRYLEDYNQSLFGRIYNTFFCSTVSTPPASSLELQRLENFCQSICSLKSIFAAYNQAMELEPQHVPVI